MADPALLAARLAAEGLRALTFAPLALANARALERLRSLEDLPAFLRMTG